MLRKVFGLCVVFAALCGCVETKWSGLKEEQAEVVQLSYVPSIESHVSGVAPGISMSGDMTIGFVSGESESPEIWAVVVRCKDHNVVFGIRSKELYGRIKPGDLLTLIYKEKIMHNPKTETFRVVDLKTVGVKLPNGGAVEIKKEGVW